MRVGSGVGIRPGIWLLVTVACAAVIAGCGSASTGQVSPDAVMKTANSFAGPNPKFFQQTLLVKRADGRYHAMMMFTACKPEGGCEAIAMDGAAYTDLQEFVDDSKFIKPGDQVLGPTDLASPGSPHRRIETLTKHVTPPWVWYVGGGVLLVLLVVGVVWLEARTRHRRVDE